MGKDTNTSGCNTRAPPSSNGRLPADYDATARRLLFQGAAAGCAAAAVSVWLLRQLVFSLGFALPVAVVIAEVLFFFWFRMRVKALGAQPKGHVPSNLDAMTAFRRLISTFKYLQAKSDAQVYLSAWFRGADFNTIRRDNVAEFMSYGFWYSTMDDMVARGLGQVPYEMVDTLQAAGGFVLPEGYNPELQTMNHLWEPLRVMYRPLTFYLGVEVLALTTAAVMFGFGFRRTHCNGVTVWCHGALPGDGRQPQAQPPAADGGGADDLSSPLLATNGAVVSRGAANGSGAGGSPPSDSRQQQAQRRTTDDSSTPLLATNGAVVSRGDDAAAAAGGMSAATAAVGETDGAAGMHRALPLVVENGTRTATAAMDGTCPAAANATISTSATATGKAGAAATGTTAAGLMQQADVTPFVLLHGVGLGLLPYLNFVRCLIATGRPVVAFQYKHVSMRLVRVIPSADTVAHTVATALRRLGVPQAAVISHSYGTCVASRLAQLHPASIQSLTLIDPVVFGMYMPGLIHNFIYRTPRRESLDKYLKDLLIFFLSRDMHTAATFCRQFYWSDINLWPEDLPPATLVVLHQNDELIHFQEVKEMVQDHASRVLTHPTHAHAGWLLDIPWQTTIVEEIHIIAAGGSGGCGPNGSSGGDGPDSSNGLDIGNGFGSGDGVSIISNRLDGSNGLTHGAPRVPSATKPSRKPVVHAFLEPTAQLRTARLAQRTASPLVRAFQDVSPARRRSPLLVRVFQQQDVSPAKRRTVAPTRLAGGGVSSGGGSPQAWREGATARRTFTAPV